MKWPSIPHLSTGGIKWLTSGLLLFALALLILAPWIIRRKHGVDPRAYLARMAVYGGLLGLAAIGAGVGAFAITRREQEYYREKARENLNALLEATREDILKKQANQNSSREEGNGHATGA